MVKKLGSIIIIVSVIVLPFRTFAVAAEKSLGFPQKAIRFIVPYPVGSGSDIQCRGVLPYVEKHLGVKILIDSRPGADSRLGLNAGWKAVPDGYTLVLPGMPAPIINEKLFPVDYKTREFTHIYAVDYNALLSLSRGSILTEVVLFWGLFLESIFLF